ncbi:ATP-grasp domain-containing protein [Streptomyces avidinii]|uniref:ATP-grasp domain-containing protein n=1 Tax=Streptomyces avidinii TaxID=1895 RepID=UPI00386E8F45|nr:ATP-grasp domain-containing protein [Streptomyces avidinii]
MKTLLVHDLGGPAPAYTLPALRARSDVALYVPRPERWDPTTLGVPDNGAVTIMFDEGGWDISDEEEAARRIADAALKWEADAVLTFSELWTVPVAIAAETLGLRGATQTGARRARDKLLMRQALASAGFRAPEFAEVTGPADVVRVLGASGPGGVLVKPRHGMSAVGIRLVEDAAQAEQVLAESLAGYTAFGMPADADRAMLVESRLVGDTGGWYVRPGLGDQICVEGLVVEGTYVPLGITDVLPKVPPFTQSAHVSPTSLTLEAQHTVLDTARRAVDALGLRTCGTHVELKLMADGQCEIIEIAARYPGRTIVDQSDRAYGTDLVGLLADALLDATPSLPPALEPGPHADRAAAATVHLYASEYLEGLPTPFGYRGIEPPPATLMDPSVRIAAFDERTHGWHVHGVGDEQPNWIVRMYLEGPSVDAVCRSANRVRHETRLRRTDQAGAARP